MALKGDYKVSKTGYMVMSFIKIKNRDLLLLLWVLVYERDERIIFLCISSRCFKVIQVKCLRCY